MNKIFLILIIFGVTFSSTAFAEKILCLQNGYKGEIYRGEGASFRAAICNENGCSNWGKWDWLKRGRTRLFTYSDNGSVKIQWNVDGDNQIQTKTIKVFLNSRGKQCFTGDSWHFSRSVSKKIGLYPGTTED